MSFIVRRGAFPSDILHRRPFPTVEFRYAFRLVSCRDPMFTVACKDGVWAASYITKAKKHRIIPGTMKKTRGGLVVMQGDGSDFWMEFERIHYPKEEDT